MSDEEDDFVQLDAYEKFYAELKILILGTHRVGKTSLLKRLIEGVFEEHSDSTSVVDVKQFKTRYCGHELKLNIWDTVGMERFSSLPSNLLRNTQGVALVYDVSNRASFHQLYDWYHCLYQSWSHQPKFPAIIVIGNKIDKENRVVNTASGEQFAKTQGAFFSETSAKTNQGVSMAFQHLVYKIMDTPGLWKKCDEMDPLVVRPYMDFCQKGKRQRRRKCC